MTFITAFVTSTRMVEEFPTSAAVILESSAPFVVVTYFGGRLFNAIEQTFR